MNKVTDIRDYINDNTKWTVKEMLTKLLEAIENEEIHPSSAFVLLAGHDDDETFETSSHVVNLTLLQTLGLFELEKSLLLNTSFNVD